MGNNKLNIRGIIGTLIFHGIIVLILVLFGFTTPLPLPQEHGILVAFGNTDMGLGNTKASLSKIVKPIKVKRATSKPKSRKINKTKATSQKILTQDSEDAPSIKSGKAKKKIKTKVKKRLTTKEKKLRKERADKKRKERIAKENIRKAKAEQKRIEDERIRAQKAQQAKIANINKKAKSMFGKKTGDNSGNSGNTSGKGNMGKTSGSLEGSYTGTGSGNSGVSYSLNGRSATNIFKPKTSFQKSGKVVVTIYVNKQGKVTRANAGARGTTTHDNKLHRLAEKAALKTSFNVNNKAAATQKGTITYIFIVK